MLKKGFLATNAFYASYAHKETDILEYLNAANQVFRQISEITASSDIMRHLDGPLRQTGFQRLT